MGNTVPRASSFKRESSTDASDDNDLLFRLQTLFLECVHTALANYFDQTLSAQSTTWDGAMENIDRLNHSRIITQSQCNLLRGNVSTSDLDIALIISLITHLDCFKVNKIKSFEELLRTESRSNTPIEADFRRLGDFWNDIFHQSSIKQKEFTRMWEETEAILLRINEVYPIANFKQTITAIRYRPINSFKQRRHRQTFSVQQHLSFPKGCCIVARKRTDVHILLLHKYTRQLPNSNSPDWAFRPVFIMTSQHVKLST